jgi:hypothetical protein
MSQDPIWEAKKQVELIYIVHAGQHDSVNATSSIVIVAMVMMVVVMMIPAIVVIVIAVRAVMMMVMMPPTVMVGSSVPDRLACRQWVTSGNQS